MARRLNYIFDVDGTLTPSRLKMDSEFQKFFLRWMQSKNVYLLTGSDRDKTIEQVGIDIWREVTESHQCGGNVVFRKGELVEKSGWKPNKSVLDVCQHLIDISKYPVKAGNHIEVRVGLLNISVVGRDCTQEQRLAYNEWDGANYEREFICKSITTMFPELEATAGGQISVDIHEYGKNKSQIRGKLQGTIHFFGDKTMEGGNDYPIASILTEPDKVFQVDGWEHTYKLLKEI
jgi:phosphomannomutase